MEMSTLYPIAATILVSLVSFAGLATLALKKNFLNSILLLLVSLSAGTLLGDSFLHLLPEALEESPDIQVTSLLVLGGIICFFILEKFILWHHHHTIETPEDHKNDHHPHEICEHQSLRLMNLLGDAFHNLLDGMVIAASFAISPIVGLSTALAVFLHEIPQEISDFGVLIHTGLPVKKALFLNFLSGIVAVLGALLVISFSDAEWFLKSLIPFTAGAFIYIAASDLIPELKRTKHMKGSVSQLLALLLGIAVMYGLLFLE